MIQSVYVELEVYGQISSDSSDVPQMFTLFKCLVDILEREKRNGVVCLLSGLTQWKLWAAAHPRKKANSLNALF